MTISAESLKIVSATAKAVADNINAITADFYPRMFAANPEVLAFFNQSNQREKRQPHALADAVVASVVHLSDLAPLKDAFTLIAHKHCALGVEAKDYKIVHDNFLGAVAHVLGSAITSEVAAAWSEVLLYLAGQLIDMEAKVYDAAEKRAGGWRGLKAFKVERVAHECPEFVSLYLATANGTPAPEWTPGQYITVCENPTTDKYFAPRHYTISSPDTLRITVKKEHAHDKPAGVMSSFIHHLKVGSIVHLRPPMGNFTREAVPKDAPEIFISAGSGITPMVAMATRAAHEGKSVAAIQVGEAAPLFEELSSVIFSKAAKKSFALRCHRDMLPGLGPILGAAGFDLATSHVFVSGPAEAMFKIGSALAHAGVNKNHVHFEAFGPKVDIFAEASAAAAAPKCPMMA